MFFTRYNRPTNPEIDMSNTTSATHQEFARECDINCILQDYQITGKTPCARDLQFGDFSSYSDYQECLGKVTQANEDFASLPSDVRARFGNDPMAFMEFATNPDNIDEMVKLGLAFRKAVEKSATDILKEINGKIVSPGQGEVGSSPAE